jgi:hypothetical protein
VAEALYEKLDPKVKDEDQLLIYEAMAHCQRNRSAPKAQSSVASKDKPKPAQKPEEQKQSYSSKRSRSQNQKGTPTIDWDKPYLKFDEKPEDLIALAKEEGINLTFGKKPRHWGVQVHKKDFSDLRDMIVKVLSKYLI